MTFDPGTTSVILRAVVDGTTYLSSGTLISENQILTSSHGIHNGTTGAVATSIEVFTGGPTQAYVNTTSSGYYIVGQQFFGDVATLRYHRLSSSSSLNPSDVSRDFAVFNLTQRASFQSRLLGWLSLFLSPEFAAAGLNATTYGYPYNSSGPSPQTQVPQSFTGPFSPGNGLYGYFNSTTPTRGGQSGGAPIKRAPNAVGQPFAVAGVVSTGDSTGSGFAAITDGAAAEIEYWQSLNLNSPPARRLYRGLLNREPDNLTASSQNYAYYQQQTAAILGRTAAAWEVYRQFPEAGPAAVLNSAEFNNMHPNISDRDLVQLVFNQALRRTASPAEIDNIVNNYPSRSDMVNAIINSPEAIIGSGFYGQDGF
jgi:hypothetical protein